MFLESVRQHDFTVTSVSAKKGSESAPRLFDLTSLQVECNKKFALSAEDTLRTIQSLYEKKITTYPRVDTTYLSDDMYPKVPAILRGLKDYQTETAPLLQNKIPKSKKVFDNSKITDHHAIIPTGVHPQNLTQIERKVFDLVAKRFIANFYPDCVSSTTTVMGKVEKVEFKTSGKQILEPGWRVIFSKDKNEDEEKKDEEKTLPAFVKGESGPHEPDLNEKWTQPPKPYTEATLLRAMETAGKQIDNDELRDLLKENGIGRPSTRANIIETLFRRNYMRKERKNIHPTLTGIELIQTIQEGLLKSAELTGLWEKKLRMIERNNYDGKLFMQELKSMVADIVNNVKNSEYKSITIEDLSKKEEAKKEKPKRTTKAKAEKKATEAQSDSKEDKQKEPQLNEEPLVCPICKKGSLLKGKAAYGCSEWRQGCQLRIPFNIEEHTLSYFELKALINGKEIKAGKRILKLKSDGSLDVE